VEGSITVTPDTTHRTPRRFCPLVVAVSAVLALGAAGCGEPLDLQVQSPSSQPEPSHASPSVPDEVEPTPLAPTPRDDRATPSEDTIRETPEFGDRRAGPPVTDEPAVEEPAVDEPDTRDPATDEPATDEPDAEQPTVLEEGDSGDAVEALQQRLATLGYWVGTTDGVYGELTEQAVLAFQGWEGLARDGRVGPETRAALDAASGPEPDADGDLIEVHLDQQVLLVVQDGRTERALHVSTGSGERYTHPSGHQAVADTPVGEWQIAWRVDGWRQSDLGRLWRPAYFHEDGIAIHGYPEVPAHPASHGCVRVSMGAMDMLWAEGHVSEGTRVVVS